MSETSGVVFVRARQLDWELEYLDHPNLPLWVACAGERLVSVSMQSRAIIEDYARRVGANVTESPQLASSRPAELEHGRSRSRLGAPGGADVSREREEPTASPAVEQLREYLDGQRRVFELELVIDPEASPFEREAWAALCRIPFGQTRSYGEQARMLAKPGAARAVGRANSRNPFAVVVPCHRVIGADGRLTGFAGGLDNKRWLLAHEGVRTAEDDGAISARNTKQLGFDF